MIPVISAATVAGHGNADHAAAQSAVVVRSEKQWISRIEQIPCELVIVVLEVPSIIGG